MVLRARDLWVAPPGVREPVVRGVSLELASGEWVVLTGANGGGKTTLALALAGLWPAERGTLELEGRAFGPHADGAQRAALGCVLQEPSSQLLQPTVREELAFAARNLGYAEAAIERDLVRLTSEFGLDRELDRDPHTLSAGRQQLVLIAGALLARPRLLIADEALAHLDAQARGVVLERLHLEARAGLALLWVTQHVEERRAADREISLGRGASSAALETSLASGASGAPLLRLSVSPWDGIEPRRVLAERAFEIEVAGSGVTALVGPNAAGKSLLLGAAAGLERLDQVQVRWSTPPYPPPSAALQFPELQLFEEQVVDEVSFSAVSRGIERSKALELAAECFEALELGRDFMSRRCWNLSTGEKRLIEVVGALIAPAALVVLDEPTAGLDQPKRQALARLVVRRAEDTSVLVASQDDDWVRAVGARVSRVGAPPALAGPSPSKKTD